MNTMLIVAMQTNDNTAGTFAAKVCADYSVTVGGVTYGDWYLPSEYELNLLYQQRSVVSGFGSGYYWSSTEYSSNLAWYQYFLNGFQNYYDEYRTFGVHAVRAF